MPTLNIQGKRVTVGEDFLSLSPEEQDEVVTGIADSIESEQPQEAGPKLNKEGFDTSGDDTYNIMASETPDVGRTENGQTYSTGGVPLGANNSAPIASKDPGLGMTAAPSGNLSEVLDEEGNLTSRAYDNLSYGDALKVYENIANHPDAQVSQSAIPGGPETIFFRGHRVPMPEPAMFGQGAKVGSVQLGGDQIIQAASNIVDLLSAGANKIAAATGGEEDIPLINRQGIEKEGFIDNVTAELPVIAAASAAGYGGANAIVGGSSARLAGHGGELQTAQGLIGKFLGRTPTIVEAGTKAAVRGTGVNASIAATQNADDSGAFVGDEPLIENDTARNLIEVLSTDGRTQSGEILAKKVNLFTDAVASGMALSGIAGVATGAKQLVYDNIFKGIFGLASNDSQRKAVATELINAFGDVPLNATREEQKVVAERMKNVFEANREVIMNGPQGAIKVDLDPMAALAMALEDSPIKADQLAGIRARTVRDDIYSSGLAEPSAKQLEYGEATDKLQDDLFEAGGREGGVETARSGIVQAGRDEVAVARGAADSAQADVDKNAARIEQIFRMDATVGQKLAALEKQGVDINIYRQGNEATEKTIQRIANGEAQLRGERNQAYQDLKDAIPDGVPINDPAFNTKFERAERSLKAETVMKWQDEQINDYKQVQLQILPDVQEAIARTDPGSEQYGPLLDLKNSIEKIQYDNLPPNVKAAIQVQKDAVDTANENYYNWFQKGPLKEVSNSQRSVREFNASGNTNRSTELTASDRSSSVIDGLFSNENRGGLQLVGEFLQSPAGGRSAKPLTDIGIAKIVQSSRKTAQTGGVGEIDSQALISGLGNFASALEKINPQQYTRLQGIISNLRQHEQNGIELERIAKELSKAADTTETQVLDKELGKFFDGSGAARMERTEGQEVFESVFTDKYNSSGRVQQVIERARQAGPEAVRGLKAAFAKSLKFTTQNTDAQTKEVDRFMKNAALIYEDQPQVLESLETGFNLIKGTRVQNENRLGIKNIGARQESAGVLGAKRLTRLIFGVLNPTATTVNTLVDIGARRFSPKDKMVQMLSQVASDGDEFVKIMDEFISDGSVNNPRRLFDFMVKAGIYTNNEEEYNSFAERLEMEQMNEDNSIDNDDTEQMLGAGQEKTRGGQEEDFLDEPKPKGTAVQKADRYSVTHLRPFNENEYRQNDDGSYSTEVTMTVQDDKGKWLNIPSLWMSPKGWVELDEDEAIQAAQAYASRSGDFPRYNSVQEAEKAASNRSHSGGRGNGSLNGR